MKRSITVVLVSALALAGCGIFRGNDSKGPRTPTVGERLPVLTFEQKLEADPALEGVLVVLPPAETNDSWTQPGGNATKSLGHLAGPANPTRAWEVSIGDGSSGRAELNAGPVIAGGKVYTIDISANVRAFDAASGRVLWSHRVEGAKKDRDTAFGGGVSVSGDKVFATTGYGVAVALNASNGAQVWNVRLGGPLRGAPAVEGDRVYVMSQDNQLFALNAATGETLWDATGTAEQAGLLSAGAPAIALDTVVVGFSSGELNALRVENGRVVWQDALARTGRTTALGALSDIDAPPVIDRGRVYAIGHGGRMAALELATGQRLWEQSLSGVSLPLVAGDYVYVVTIDAELVCMTRSDGKIKWVKQLPRYKKEKSKKDPLRWAGPLLVSDHLYLTGSNGQMLKVSPMDGTLQGTIKLPGRTYQPPIAAGGTIYVLTDDGKLAAYR